MKKLIKGFENIMVTITLLEAWEYDVSREILNVQGDVAEPDTEEVSNYIC